MSGSLLLAYLCAALAAMGNALANVMQRKSSLEQPEGRAFDASLLWDLVRNPTWLLGFGGLVGSFVLQGVALGLGPLSAVEPVITLEVPLTLLVASRVFRARLGRTEWGGILTMTFGMIVLVAVLNPRPGNANDVSHPLYVVAGGATAATIVALVLASRRGGSIWATACLGAAAGTSFGFTATLLKETIDHASVDGVLGIFSAWQTYVAVMFGVLGLVLVQWALHEGPLLAAQPGFTLMDPLVSVLWGVLVFNETTRSGPWLLPATLGAVLVGVGVSVLAHSPLLAQSDTPTRSRHRPVLDSGPAVETAKP